jgi:hypothetical protein
MQCERGDFRVAIIRNKTAALALTPRLREAPRLNFLNFVAAAVAVLDQDEQLPSWAMV